MFNPMAVGVSSVDLVVELSDFAEDINNIELRQGGRVAFDEATERVELAMGFVYRSCREALLGGRRTGTNG